MRNFVLLRRIVLGGFLLNVAFCLVSSFAFDLIYPYDTFLFRPLDRFQDFYTVLRSTAELDPYRVREVVDVPGHAGVEVSNYFPLTHIVLYPFTLVDQDVALTVFLGLFLLGLSFAFWKIGERLQLGWAQLLFSWLVFIFCSYPILFSADRGNLECWTFLLCAGGIYAITAEKCKTGAVLIGIAAAMKAFPLIFLYPLLKRRSFGTVALSVATFLLLSLISLALFKGTVASNLESMRLAFTTFNGFLLAGGNGITHSINLFSAGYTAVIFYQQDLTDVAVLQPWRDAYGIFVMVALASLVIYLWRARLEAWKQWALLVAAVQILPFPSFDYKLIYTLIPLTFLVLDQSGDRRLRKYIWIMGLTVVPKVVPLFGDVRTGVILNPLLILAGVILIILDPPPPVVVPARAQRRRKA